MRKVTLSPAVHGPLGNPLQIYVDRFSGHCAVTAKMIIYQAFIESELEVPRHLERRVHDLYFSPQYPEFEPGTLWSLSNTMSLVSQLWQSFDALVAFNQPGKEAFAEQRDISS